MVKAQFRIDEGGECFLKHVLEYIADMKDIELILYLQPQTEDSLRR